MLPYCAIAILNIYRTLYYVMFTYFIFYYNIIYHIILYGRGDSGAGGLRRMTSSTVLQVLVRPHLQLLTSNLHRVRAHLTLWAQPAASVQPEVSIRLRGGRQSLTTSQDPGPHRVAGAGAGGLGHQ